MTDIVTRLRTWGKKLRADWQDPADPPMTVADEAADEIERLRVMVDQYHDDFDLLYIAWMYGNPPSPWNEQRQQAFKIAMFQAELRHRTHVNLHNGKNGEDFVDG